MGFWGTSTSDRIKDQIQDEVKNINQQLQNVENLLNQHRGICSRNVEQVANVMQNLHNSHQVIQRLLDSLTASQQANLTLPWMDGRYLPLYMWDGSYQLVMKQILRAIEEYERNPYRA